MILKGTILVSLILFKMLTLFSQSVAFTYDASGNRITRTIVVEQLQSNAVTFPVADPKSFNSAELKGTVSEEIVQPETSAENVRVRITEESINASESEKIVTMVFPNPTNGLLKINISNMPSGAVTEMKLYDLSGKEMKVKRNFESSLELDISQVEDGIYILRLKINEFITDWKIIKSQ